jgi:small ligand-binding sensory domain FIST
MSVRIGTGLSTSTDVRAAAVEAAQAARDGLGGRAVDVAVVFAAGGHLTAPEVTLDGVREALAPAALIGCGASGIVADGREVEEGTAVSVWAAHLDGGRAQAFAVETHEVEDGLAVVGFPELAGAAAVVLLPDPAFPTEAILHELAVRAPGVPVLGGLASAHTLDGEPALFFDDRVLAGGAVGLRLDDVEVLPCVSQGARPLGPELTVTASEGPIVQELAGRPAITKLREVIDELPAADRAHVAEGLLMGIVIDGGKPDYVQGDFLVRGLVGGDPETGAVALGAPVAAGQVVRLHARDAASADRDLRDALALRRVALGDAPPAGALVFTCNGRGRGMFGVPDHDAALVRDELAGAPAAGFFAAGEIGPVGGASFVHAFTATVALFGR